MEIRLGSLVRDAREAAGTVIVIDVFRAFTTAAIAFSNGASDITLVAEAEDALALHRSGVGDVLMGEVDGKRPHGFNYGNSPHEISQVDLTGKSLVQSTRAGTVGVAAAFDAPLAQAIYLGSLRGGRRYGQGSPARQPGAGNHRGNGRPGGGAGRRRRAVRHLPAKPAGRTAARPGGPAPS